MEAALRKGRVGSAGQGLSTRKGLCSRNWGLKAELTGQEEKIQNGFNSAATVVSRRYFHSWIHSKKSVPPIAANDITNHHHDDIRWDGVCPADQKEPDCQWENQHIHSDQVALQKDLYNIHNNDVVFLVHEEA